MRVSRLMWQLLAGYLVVMLVPLVLVSWYTSELYRQSFVGQVIDVEGKIAYLIGREILTVHGLDRSGPIDSLCKRLSRDIAMRITVILPSGAVIGDSDHDPAQMENHAYRPEVIKALKGETGVSERMSTTAKKKMLYVASPLMSGDSISAVIRTAVPLDRIVNERNAYYRKISVAALLFAMIAFFMAMLYSRRVTVPVRELETAARRFSKGNLDEKVVVGGIEELKSLGAALNDMAVQLHGRIQTIEAQNREREAILLSMTEAVIAVNDAGRVLSVNEAAASLFEIDPIASRGKLLGEIIRSSAFQQFAERVLEAAQPLTDDLTFTAPHSADHRELVLQVHGSVLRDAANRSSGAVLVATDVTRLRQLETVRSEFVANVSHELRTPLTAIKGFVETLQQGAIDNRDDAVRFLGIIESQVDRLVSLVDDLLTLARIEREEEARSIKLNEGPLMPVVAAALRDYTVQAASKDIQVALTGDPGIRVVHDAALLEQAIGNLIDNAIKYSESGKRVDVRVEYRDGQAYISVTDQGIGIPQEHIDRIFERFYRVDKARSRKAGGTGLGLSIVKHIVALHNGTVSVQSVPGEGSTFTIALPGTQTTGVNHDQ